MLVLLALGAIALAGCAEGTSHSARIHAATGATRIAAHAGTSDPDPGAPPALLPAAPPQGTPVSVTVGARPSGPAGPTDFLGLSFELRSLPTIASYGAALSGTQVAAPAGAGGSNSVGAAAASPDAPGGDLLALLRSLGPGVLRFGGVSADEEAAWAPTGKLPRWARVAITPRELAGLATLARASGWRVLLTVNLGHYDPAAAARESAAAHAALGPYLAGIEIGNEPDRYVRKHLRAAGWNFTAYRAQAAAYRAAIEHAAPGVPIAGPDPSTGTIGLGWLDAAARTLHPALLTDHFYPLSSCGYRPTIGELLSPGTLQHGRQALAQATAIARRARRPLRIDEANSISCEGRPGVSNTFAAALWALEYIARASVAGVAGVNFHDLPARADSYSPLFAPDPAALAAGDLRAAPEWYALLAARELPGSRPLAAAVIGAVPGELGVSAFRAPDGRLRLVLVDYDPPGSGPLVVHLQGVRVQRDVRVRAHAGARARAHTAPSGTSTSAFTAGAILRLTGPAPAATGGVRLAGRTVAPNGSWRPPPRLPALYTHAGAFSLQIDPSSAAVVTLYPD
ncbi:MAG TPA: hypothetical protein VMS02_04100 [Solirubrobacteraceae bacterium]|nr:hypothetical protein [Solirubrobacteraceae bacterium]